MLISIVVSAYNIEKYIEECVESILQQSFNDFECILVDDGSTDLTGSICDKYSRENGQIRVIHKKNGGISSARNIGIYNAKGDYIYFVDGDDKISSNCLMDFVKIINQLYPDVILGHMMKFNNSMSPESFGDIVKNNWLINLNGKEAFIIIHEYMRTMPMGIRGIYKKEFLISNNLYFNEEYRYSEDQEWTVRCFEKASIVRSNENPGYLYRMGREGSLMNTLNIKKINMLLKIYDEWYKKIIKDPVDSFNICLYQVLIQRFWDLYFLCTPMLSAKEQGQFFELMDERKFYIIKKIKVQGIEKKIFLIKYFKSKTIYKFIKIWMKLHEK